MPRDKVLSGDPSIEVEHCSHCPLLSKIAPKRCELEDNKRAVERAVIEGEYPPDWCPLRARPVLVHLGDKAAHETCAQCGARRFPPEETHVQAVEPPAERSH